MSAFERCPLTGAVHWRRFNFNNTNILKIKLYTGNNSIDNNKGMSMLKTFLAKLYFTFLLYQK